MTEEFSALKQEVDELAAEYAKHGKSIAIREKIWLLLWEMRRDLFRAEEIRGYTRFAPSGQYETGEEFLGEVLSYAIPKALDSYADTYGDTLEPPPFMKYFNSFYFRKVYSAYSHIQDKMPHDHIIVRKPAIRVYLEPREDAVIPDTFLKMKRRILGRVSDGRQTWIKTKMKGHGTTVYVREEDVECCGKAAPVDIDSIAEQASPERVEDRVIAADTYEGYILNLLSLVEQLYSRTSSRRGTGLSRQYCFKLLYTETLLDKLKKTYNAIGSVWAAHERDALSVTESDLLNYLLVKECSSFTAIAVTPLHAKRDYDYLHSDSPEEIRLPAANLIYTHFLLDVKGIDRKPETIAPSFSKYRTEFKRQHDLICETEIV